jgi:hypothetical protein
MSDVTKLRIIRGISANYTESQQKPQKTWHGLKLPEEERVPRNELLIPTQQTYVATQNVFCFYKATYLLNTSVFLPSEVAAVAGSIVFK